MTHRSRPRPATPFWRRALATTAALGALALGSAAAQAEQVQVFEAPPTVMQLLDALGETSSLGKARGIEITGAASAPPAPAQNPIRPASATSRPAAATPTAAPSRPAPTPAAAPAPSQEGGAFAFRIRFAFDSAEIDPSFHDHLASVAQLMAQRPDIALVIEGHTDSVGDAAYNEALSQRRAAAVRSFLVRAGGIEPSRLQVVGRGESQPLTADGRDAANRRVQFARAN